MKNMIKKLLALNIIYYLNNYLYVFLESKYGIDGFIGLWSFSPYIFILFTGFIMESSFRKTYKKIKEKAILDMLLRVVALFINYYITTFQLGSLIFNLLIGLEISIMSVNIFLEIKMYKEINLIIENKHHIEQDILTNQEMKTVIKEYYHLDSIYNISILELY